MSDALIRPARIDDAEALHHHCYPQASLDDVRDYLIWSLRQGHPITLPVQKEHRDMELKVQRIVNNKKFLHERGFKVLDGEDPYLGKKWIVVYDVEFHPLEKWSHLEPQKDMTFIILKTKPVRYTLVR